MTTKETELKAQEMPTGNIPSAFKAEHNELEFLNAIRSGIPKKIQTVNGDSIEIKKITWRKRIEGLRIVNQVYDEVWNPTGEEEKYTLKDAFKKLIEVCPDKLTELVALVTGQTKDWIEENLEDVAVLEVALPFFESSVSIRDQMMEKVVPEIGMIAKTIRSRSTNSRGE